MFEGMKTTAEGSDKLPRFLQEMMYNGTVVHGHLNSMINSLLWSALPSSK